jgi:TPR repeat protein
MSTSAAIKTLRAAQHLVTIIKTYIVSVLIFTLACISTCRADEVAADIATIEAGIAALERKDHARAFRLFIPLATKGNTRVQFIVGTMFEAGHGTKVDGKEAFKWYLRAAVGGLAEAQAKVGEMYLSGVGIARSYSRGFEWRRRAADQGDVTSQYVVGLAFELGQGVIQDYAEALKWHLSAAAMQHPGSQLRLAVMYASGNAGTKDLKVAHMWANLSAASGDEAAVSFREVLAKNMTPSEIADAQMMARNCQQSGFKSCH